MDAARREGSIELLRIIAMIAIVSGHVIVHGDFENIPRTANGCVAIMFTQGSRLAVNCFVLITGYFLHTDAIPWKKVGNIHRQIFFYSVGIFLAMILFGEVDLNIKTAVKALLPVITSQYWFATTYLLLLLASPLLNICINYVSQRVHLEFILLFFALWSIFPTLLVGSPGFSNFGWFVWLYLLAAYIRKYPSPIFAKIRLTHGIILYMFIVIAAAITFYFGYHVAFLRENAQFFFGELNRVPAVLCSVLIFIACLNLKLPESKFINWIAASVFGVYLLHDNPFIREFLWGKVFNVAQYLTSSFFAVYVFFSISTIFVVGIIIDTLRRIADRQICLLMKSAGVAILSKAFIQKLHGLFHN